MLTVWTGSATSTTDMLKRVERFSAASSHQYTAAMTELKHCAVSVHTSWLSGAPDTTLLSLGEFTQALREFDVVTGTGIWSPLHAQIDKIAAATGVLYKPSGAGGGDFGIAFSQDEARLKSLSTQLETTGFSVPEFLMGVPGMAIESQS